MNDVITINDKQLPYPSAFVMKEIPNVVCEITTMSGQTIADVNGWKYADTTLEWGALLPEYMDDLIEATNAPNIVVTFLDTDGFTKSVNAILKGLNHAKTRYRNDGSFVWEDVSVSLSFPDAYQYDGSGGRVGPVVQYDHWDGGSY